MVAKKETKKESSKVVNVRIYEDEIKEVSGTIGNEIVDNNSIREYLGLARRSKLSIVGQIKKELNELTEDEQKTILERIRRKD